MFDQIPLERNGYAGEEQWFAEYSYDILKADTTTLRSYRSQNGEMLWLFVAYFQSQKYGSQIHSPRHCLPGGGWRIERHERFDLPLDDGTSKEMNRLLLRQRDRKQLMFYWFETRSGAVTGEFALKWNLMTNSLMLRPTDAAFIRLDLPVNHSETLETTTARAVNFLQAFHADIERALPFGN